MSADAPSKDPQQTLQELSNNLMSPYCPGKTIASCSSQNARKLEDTILEQAKAGKSADEIESELVEQFGEHVIGYRPPPYLVGGTVVLGAIGIMGLVAVGRRWVQGRTGAATNPSSTIGTPTQAELDALEDALDEDEEF